jgi:hypothetical protein
LTKGQNWSCLQNEEFFFKYLWRQREGKEIVFKKLQVLRTDGTMRCRLTATFMCGANENFILHFPTKLKRFREKSGINRSQI